MSCRSILRLTGDQSDLLDGLINVGLDELAQLAGSTESAYRIRQLAAALATLSPRATDDFAQHRSLAAFRGYERTWARAAIKPHAYVKHLELIFSGRPPEAR